MHLVLDKKSAPMNTVDLPDHRIRAVCFDLDGVLVDAPEWHKEAFNMALEHFGLQPLSDEEHLKTFNGLSTRVKLEILQKQGRLYTIGPWSNTSHDDFYNKKQEYTQQLIEHNCVPIERIIETVRHANRLFDNKTAVVTNCSRRTAELMLEKSGLSGLFQFIITNEDVDGKIKPHPWPYILAQNKLGFANTSKVVLAIDDTGKGIMSAVDAHMRTWRLRRFEDLSVTNLNKVLDYYRITI